GEGRLDVGPGDLELLGGPDCIPFLRSDEADEALLPDDLHTWNVFHGRLVHRDRNGAGDRRTDHASVQHAGDSYVRPAVERPEPLRGDMAPGRAGPADDLVFTRRLGLAFAGDQELVAEMLVPRERHVEVTAANELAVGDRLAGVVLVADDAIG